MTLPPTDARGGHPLTTVLQNRIYYFCLTTLMVHNFFQVIPAEGRFSFLPKRWEIEHVRSSSDSESHNGRIQNAAHLALGSTPEYL